MVAQALTSFKQRQSKLRGDSTDEEIAQKYASILQQGRLRQAVRYLTDRDGGAVLSPDDPDSKTGRPVREILEAKHPRLRDVHHLQLKEYDELPEFEDVVITGDTVEKVARRLSGSAGLINFDSHAMKNLLLSHKDSSRKLRDAIARFASWLANENVPWAAYRGLMMCREVALDKMPGIRPIGIGEIFRRLIAKCVLEAAGPQATSACGSDQLCAGLKLGCEGGIHAMSALWDELSVGEDVGFLMIDADNGFNAYSRIRMLWTIRHLWPAGARFVFNCYKFQSMLIVRDPGGLNYLILYSREGVTQGDPLSMFCYAIGTLPLIRKLKEMRPDRPRQSWYADDASAIGNFEALHSLFTDLASIGPTFGYLPNASKSILVVPEHRVAAAEHFFQ